MAETKQPNQLVERIVRILSKRKTDDLDFTQIGVIKAFSYEQNNKGDFKYNFHKYDPSSIEDFFKAYEASVVALSVSKFTFIGTQEMFKTGRYK